MMSNNNYVLFWGGIYSNWYPCKFTLDGVTYTSTEQHMMHQKALTFNDVETAAKVMEASHPSQQKKLGREIKNYNDKIWSEVRYEIVKRGCRAKFEQNPDLKEQLLADKGKEFVEASPEDKIWGVGFHSDQALFNKPKWGLNLLGKLLTELSNEIT
jgi:ribA/ribD-fused uncharacterized protein